MAEMYKSRIGLPALDVEQKINKNIARSASKVASPEDGGAYTA